jgi:nucleoside-diphosphate-sugar epimerase
MKVLVIGGTLFIGRLLVKELAKERPRSRRSAPQAEARFRAAVENVMADRNDAGFGKRFRRRFDVVFDNAYDWERGTTAAQVEATVRWATAHRATFSCPAWPLMATA